MTRTLAIFNQKGGVGKTTTAINLAAGLALAGKRTLLVDVDPQGNATTGLGAGKSTLEFTTYDVLMGERSWRDAMISTGVSRLHLLPATLDLAGAVVELADVPGRELCLRNGLREVEAAFDYVIIDTPPSLGLLSINCLAAADCTIIPMQCEFYALEGLAQVEHTLRLVRRQLNQNLSLFGILLTMVDARSRLCRDVIDAVRTQYRERVFDTLIPRTVRIAEAPSYGEPVLTYDKRGKGAGAYQALTQEVLAR
jgi:chromosome partitioning protein